MEKKLAALFDFQKFAGNPDLRQVIDAVHTRISRRELSPNELEYVNAAGDPSLMQQNTQEKPKE